ncbi:cyclodeaminase/cyclohydrolase family protein [Flavobacterium sp. I-STPA6A]|uniref:cyclodeaminase/cyclohydrolase family protein n=1 Tax=Flavobacterium sp. I-STPA6A TaxID=2590450 RepID=UPI00131CA035|nr:cyclodeaminase/cyclohydrolase family protein [Flavobacterium sp. I-STPA6A]
MVNDLLNKTVNELMEKFGAGNHKPGSGSAAAFQGMVSAKLISTVISLTADEKRKHLYSSTIDQHLDYYELIEKKIYPKLSELFISDSIQFDKTINSRIARDTEKDEFVKNQLRRQALEELKVSIEIPFEIASLCRELADIAAFVFDNGFKAARGDSQVGLSGSVSAISGCIAIIRLNVLSFSSDEYQYTKDVVNQVNDLEIDYKNLSVIVNDKIQILKDEFDKKIPLFEGMNKLINKYKASTNTDIEKCVREIQILIWDNKHLIWKKNIPKSNLEILKPEIIFKQVMGYDYVSTASYGVSTEDNTIEVAGIIDQPNKIVAISNTFPENVKMFTAAHELGHAILHKQSILHRDIPVEHLGHRVKRDKVELDADKFATFFLMPTKWVKIEFENRFGNDIFEIDENTSFKFGGRNISEIKNECKNIRSLSRKLSSTEIYDGNNFISLFKLFNVSIEAMAIRLEELKLLNY